MLSLCRETGARASSIGDAASAAEVVVLAVPHAALEEVLRNAGTLSGKIVIDCTNGLGPGPSLITTGCSPTSGGANTPSSSGTASCCSW
jgi:predicted dinucleotide-binding enzyme